MILRNEYLTDEELMQLISEVEENDLVPAPPDCMKNIVNTVFDKPSKELKRRKQREFAGYCFRVGMSVAAAVAFIFIMPYLPGFDGTVNEVQTPEQIQDNYEKPPEVPDWIKEELSTKPPVWENMDAQERKVQNYPTKEEVLNDKGILNKVFEGNNIFKETNKWNIFTEKDGGQ